MLTVFVVVLRAVTDRVSMSNMRIAVPLLLLASGASALSSLPSSPSSLLRQWRAERARATAAQLDPSRYHLQLLFVDDDNARGRVAEGMLEVAEGFGSVPEIVCVTATN